MRGFKPITTLNRDVRLVPTFARTAAALNRIALLGSLLHAPSYLRCGTINYLDRNEAECQHWYKIEPKDRRKIAE